MDRLSGIAILGLIWSMQRWRLEVPKGEVMPVDLRLYALVDPERAGGRDLAELARLVVQGGATLVQLRDKVSETRRLMERARAIKAALAPFHVPVLIND